MRGKRIFGLTFISLLALTILSTIVCENDSILPAVQLKSSGDSDPEPIIDIQGIGWT
jgi:hypothetical protein